MKNAIPLREFVQQHSQRRAAELIGVTPAAVAQMLSNGRNVFLEPVETGWKAFEVKAVGRKG